MYNTLTSFKSFISRDLSRNCRVRSTDFFILLCLHSRDVAVSHNASKMSGWKASTNFIYSSTVTYKEVKELILQTNA